MNEIDNNSIRNQDNEKRLKKILSKHFKIKSEKIDNSTLITNTGETRPWGKLLDLYRKIEKEFDISIPIEDIEKIKTVQNCLNYISYNQENS